MPSNLLTLTANITGAAPARAEQATWREVCIDRSLIHTLLVTSEHYDYWSRYFSEKASPTDDVHFWPLAYIFETTASTIREWVQRGCFKSGLYSESQPKCDFEEWVAPEGVWMPPANWRERIDAVTTPASWPESSWRWTHWCKYLNLFSPHRMLRRNVADKCRDACMSSKPAYWLAALASVLESPSKVKDFDRVAVARQTLHIASFDVRYAG